MGSRRRRGARSLAGSGKTGVPFTGRERERRRWLQQTVMQFALDVAWLWCSREGPPLPPPTRPRWSSQWGVKSSSQRQALAKHQLFIREIHLLRFRAGST